MHYMNGRPANDGDVIVHFTGYPTKRPLVGVLFNAQAGNDFCNGTLLPISGLGGTTCPNLAQCLHLDDVMSALPEDLKAVPDTSISSAKD